jgi:transcriptional regulator with XRE-family HTH domain
MKIFGERLKELRLEKKYTQKMLADKLQISHNTIHAWETNKQEPSMMTLLELSDIFGVSLDYLFGKSDY